MTCGCSQPAPGTVCRVRKGVDLSVRKVERYAMCAGCPNLSSNGVACTIDGRDVGDHVASADCPRGWFPNRRGHVRWAGLVWIGVPMPVRLYLWAAHGTPVGKFPGCGCVRVLKTRWRLALRMLRPAG